MQGNKKTLIFSENQQFLLCFYTYSDNNNCFFKCILAIFFFCIPKVSNQT